MYRALGAVFLLLWRWLPLRRRWGVIQLIAGLSTIGIAIGIATLLSVMSIFKGFHSAVEELILQYDPHLRIVAMRGQYFQLSPDSIQRYAALLHARAVMPTVNARLIAQRAESFAPAVLIATPEAVLREATRVPHSIVLGDFALRLDGMPACVIGAGLAERLHALPGDTLWLWTPTVLERLALGIPWQTGFPLVVAGIFQSPGGEHQSFAIYADTAVGRRLVGIPPQAWSAIDIWLDDSGRTPWAVSLLRRTLPASLMPVPWYEIHRQLYEVLRLERLGTFAVLSLIVLVAVFNVTASLRMSAVQKRRELAVAQALGLPERGIQLLYLGQGSILGGLGVLAGTLGGLGFYWGQRHFGWFRLDPTRYILTTLPVRLDVWDVLLVAFVGFAIVVAAALYPARWAARQPLAEALHEE